MYTYVHVPVLLFKRQVPKQFMPFDANVTINVIMTMLSINVIMLLIGLCLHIATAPRTVHA